MQGGGGNTQQRKINGFTLLISSGSKRSYQHLSGGAT